MKYCLFITNLSLFFVLTFHIFGVADGQNQLECNSKSDRIADQLFAQIITFGNSGVKFPESLKVINRFCRAHSERVKTLEVYVKKCKTGLSKQLLSVFVYTIKSQIKQLCKKDSKRRQGLINAGKCVNVGRDEFEKCNVYMIDALQGIKLADDKKKIPLTCCEYHKYKNCFQEKGKNVSICSVENLNTILDFIDSINSNALSLLCGDYSDGSDKCEKLESPPKKDKKERRTKSFFLPFLDVFESFAEI